MLTTFNFDEYISQHGERLANAMLNHTEEACKNISDAKKRETLKATFLEIQDQLDVDMSQLINALNSHILDDSVSIAEVAARLSVSVNECNSILTEAGLQEKVNGQWVLTKDGEKYGSMNLINSDGNARKEIRWKDRVADLFLDEDAV